MELSEHFAALCDRCAHFMSTKSLMIRCQLNLLASEMMEACDPRPTSDEGQAKGFTKGYFFLIDGEIVNI